MDRGLIFNIQRYCLHDGPGIRTTLFLKGCPLSCRWCHNPESQSGQLRIGVTESRCARCGYCVESCPHGGQAIDHRRLLGKESEALKNSEQRTASTTDCELCGACVAACPTGARQILGREMSVKEVVQEVLRDRTFHDTSGGGITLSGGEPLQQPGFLRELLKAFRAESLHTALDTCGFAPRQALVDVVPWVDLVLYDLKCLDDTAHRQWTGVSNQRILENLQTLAKIHDNIWIRIPLVAGFNLAPSQLDAAARFVASIPAVRQVNLLPYHRIGTGKLKQQAGGSLDAPSEELAIPEISPEQLAEASAIFRAAGLHTLIGG